MGETPIEGLEPSTTTLRALRSTNWAKRARAKVLPRLELGTMDSKSIVITNFTIRPKGEPGFEPGTYRTAADCSTPELLTRVKTLHTTPVHTTYNNWEDNQIILAVSCVSLEKNILVSIVIHDYQPPILVSEKYVNNGALRDILIIYIFRFIW